MKRPIKNNIRTFRMRRGLSQKEVARLLGHRNQSLLSHWENGNKLPSLMNLFKLSAALKVPGELLYRNLFQSANYEVHQRKKKFGIWERY